MKTRRRSAPKNESTSVVLVILFLDCCSLIDLYRYLPLNFQILQFPNQEEVLPTWLVILLTMILPVAVFLVFQIALRSAHDFHHACLGLFEVLSSTISFLTFHIFILFLFCFYFIFFYIHFIFISLVKIYFLILYYQTLVFNLVFTTSMQYLGGKYSPDWYTPFSPSPLLSLFFSSPLPFLPLSCLQIYCRYDLSRAGTPNVLKEGRLSYP